MRRTLLITAAVVLLIALGVGVYFVFFTKKGGLTVGQGTSFPSSDTNGANSAVVSASTQELGVPLANAGTDIAPGLVRITNTPVSLGSVATYVPGQVAGTSTATSAPLTSYQPDVRVEYIERESGNIYDYQAHARTLTRLSNKTLPGVEEATWLPDGSLAYARFLDKGSGSEHIGTYALPATGTGGYFLEPGLAQVIARGTSTLVTLLSTTDGSSATISTPSGAGVRTLFTTALSAIRVAFSGNNYVVTTKGSATSDGYAFLVDAKTGGFTRILGPLQGFSTLASPSGKYLLYNYLDRGKPALAVLDLGTHVATRLPLATLSEKCAWSSDSFTLYCGVPTTMTGKIPDDWYQGAISFSDRLWKIDMITRDATLLISPKQAGNTDVDAVGLTVDSTNDVLIFMNKIDSDLYAYDL